jgi:hypothetical protein
MHHMAKEEEQYRYYLHRFIARLEAHKNEFLCANVLLVYIQELHSSIRANIDFSTYAQQLLNAESAENMQNMLRELAASLQTNTQLQQMMFNMAKINYLTNNTDNDIFTQKDAENIVAVTSNNAACKNKHLSLNKLNDLIQQRIETLLRFFQKIEKNAGGMISNFFHKFITFIEYNVLYQQLQQQVKTMLNATHTLGYGLCNNMRFANNFENVYKLFWKNLNNNLLTIQQDPAGLQELSQKMLDLLVMHNLYYRLKNDNKHNLNLLKRTVRYLEKLEIHQGGTAFIQTLLQVLNLKNLQQLMKQTGVNIISELAQKQRQTLFEPPSAAPNEPKPKFLERNAWFL